MTHASGTALAALHAAGLGQRHLLEMLRAGGDPASLLGRPSVPAVRRALGGKVFGRLSAEAIAARASLADPDAAAAALAECGARAISFGTDAYPPQLYGLPNPPAILYVRGKFPDFSVPWCAVVGSRNPSAEGRRHVRMVAGGLAAAGVPVVSGGAFGIDCEAHLAALEAGGPTVCVTGTGPDVDYPARHAGLYARIAESGAVVSIFPPGTAGRPEFFPVRNEIVVGLSRGAVIGEAREKSGTLITARLALEYGRDLFVCPGDMARSGCRGSNGLLRDGGAKCVLGAEDVLAEWGLARPEAPKPAGTGDDVADALLAAISEKPSDADALCAALGLASGEVLGRLARLEAAGRVGQDGAGRYFLLS